jgi:hypothetical protein
LSILKLYPGSLPKILGISIKNLKSSNQNFEPGTIDYCSANPLCFSFGNQSTESAIVI